MPNLYDKTNIIQPMTQTRLTISIGLTHRLRALSMNTYQGCFIAIPMKPV